MSDKTLDELINLIEQNNKQVERPAVVKSSNKSPKLLRSVERFIEENNIHAGVAKYPTYVLYYIYSKFCEEYQYKTHAKKASRVQFGRIMSKLVDRVRHGKQRYYLTNKFIEITPELIEKAKKHLKRTKDIVRYGKEKKVHKKED